MNYSQLIFSRSNTYQQSNIFLETMQTPPVKWNDYQHSVNFRQNVQLSKSVHDKSNLISNIEKKRTRQGKTLNILTKFCRMSEATAVQKYAELVDLEKYRKTIFYWQIWLRCSQDWTLQCLVKLQMNTIEHVLCI